MSLIMFVLKEERRRKREWWQGLWRGLQIECCSTKLGMPGLTGEYTKLRGWQGKKHTRLSVGVQMVEKVEHTWYDVRMRFGAGMEDVDKWNSVGPGDRRPAEGWDDEDINEDFGSSQCYTGCIWHNASDDQQIMVPGLSSLASVDETRRIFILNRDTRDSVSVSLGGKKQLSVMQQCAKVST